MNLSVITTGVIPVFKKSEIESFFKIKVPEHYSELINIYELISLKIDLIDMNVKCDSFGDFLFYDIRKILNDKESKIYNNLYEALIAYKTNDIKIRTSEITGIQERFKLKTFDNLSHAEPPEKIKGFIPDAWVIYNNELAPVEVKKDSFTKKSLSQLKNYIKEYKCNYGVAVAPKLSVKLPDNIIFIEMK